MHLFFQIFLDHCVLIGKINISNSSSTNKIWKGESAAALYYVLRKCLFGILKDDSLIFLSPFWRQGVKTKMRDTWLNCEEIMEQQQASPLPRILVSCHALEGIPCFSSKRIMGQNYTYVVREGHSSEKKGFLLNLIL